MEKRVLDITIMDHAICISRNYETTAKFAYCSELLALIDAIETSIEGKYDVHIHDLREDDRLIHSSMSYGVEKSNEISSYGSKILKEGITASNSDSKSRK